MACDVFQSRWRMASWRCRRPRLTQDLYLGHCERRTACKHPGWRPGTPYLCPCMPIHQCASGRPKVLLQWHPNKPSIVSTTNHGNILIWNCPSPERWGAFAGGFEEVDENVEYEEREDEFDIVRFRLFMPCRGELTEFSSIS
jgi:hypothetical protein